MHKLICSLAIVSCTVVNAQTLPVDPATNQIAYSEVVDVPGVSKADLYVRAGTWFSRTFRSAKSVLELQDKEAGKLIGNGSIPVTIKVPIVGATDAGSVAATITIQCKDGKYKYSFENLTHSRPFGANTQQWVDGGPLEQEKPKVGMMMRPSKREWSSIKESVDKDIKGMIDGLKKNMAKSDDF